MRVLGIETSCDDTGIAIYDSEQGIVGESLYSQVALHADYGGVVPELASRDHIRKTLPLIKSVLDQANYQASDIDGIAYTAGPGLVGALLVGASVGRSLAYSWQIPAVAVHHMEGHLLAPMLEDNPPTFPFVALLVSGGHTLLIKVEGIGQYDILGESLDDAAGEAFDKVAKMFGLDYPGGPAVARMAEKGDAERFVFPRPMTDRPGLDFSFSGLKTSVMNTIRQQGGEPSNAYTSGIGIDDQVCADIAAGFQKAVVDTMVIKCKRALQATDLSRLVVAGGVSANIELRSGLNQAIRKVKGEVFYPRPAFCTDNGAMIAYAGCKRLMAGEEQGLSVSVKARWPLNQL